MQNIAKQQRHTHAIVAALLLLALVMGLVVYRNSEKNRPPVLPPAVDGSPQPFRLSPLAEAPQWDKLAAYHGTMKRNEFEMSLNTIFTCSDEWKKYFHLSDDHVMIKTAAMRTDEFFRLEFAPNQSSAKPAQKSWRTPAEMPQITQENRPLDGIHIAIDAGHIGGNWAQMEERWFRIGDSMPVMEGEMTLRVAHLLKPEIEKLGATVSLVRDRTEPLTTARPESLVKTIAADDPRRAIKQAEMLFYRTAEIRARAAKVNQELKPDIVLCLHFNADAWGDPANPQLVEDNHFHILLNGAYTDDELSYDDQRFEMTQKILQRTIDEEASLGAVMAQTFVDLTAMPPYPYSSDSTRARNINGNPYLWARNLIANRLYECPVIFFEPYVMNSTSFHQRIQLGDYDGMIDVAGKPQLSIYREYTKAVVDGLVAYYRENRKVGEATE